MLPLAILAALRAEVAPLLRRFPRARARGRGSARWFCGELLGRPVILGWTGDGRPAAEAGIAALLAEHQVSGLIVLGVAGGLSPALAPGAVLAAHEVRDVSGPAPWPDPRWLEQALTAAPAPLYPGVLFSADRILVQAASKAELWRHLGEPAAAAVDLETAAYARAAAAHGVPYLAFRAISDSAHETLPLDFNRFCNARGQVSRTRVMAHALRHPRLVPELRQLQTRVHQGAVQLERLIERLLPLSRGNR